MKVCKPFQQVVLYFRLQVLRNIDQDRYLPDNKNVAHNIEHRLGHQMHIPSINIPSSYNLFRSLLVCATLTLIFSGCKDRSSNSTQVIATSPAVTVPATSPPVIIPASITDEWLGKWDGPEGTFLQLNGGDGKYEIIIQNLDGPLTFQGVASGNQIEFKRDGVKESLHASNGAETGMKWLSEKSNCLTVRAGEGYCRD